MATARITRIPGAIILLITILSLSLPAYAQYSGGTGEPNDPYQIATSADLIALGNEPNDYDKHFILTADINLDPNLPGCKVFDRAVIGSFAGVFDGKGRTISHLTIKGGSNLGLFGDLEYGGKVKDVAVMDASITGAGDFVGGLAGLNRGIVEQCYSAGAVTGTDDHVGGLVGIGSSGAVTACFWDTQTSGQGQSAGGTGKTTAEMQTASTFLEAGWDFVGETANGTEDIWWILEGQDYPRLWWEAAEQ